MSRNQIPGWPNLRMAEYNLLVLQCTCYMYMSQGSKLTLVRWPVASGYSVGPVKSTINWPGWPVKFWNPTSEFTWLIANSSYWMNLYCKYFNWIHWYKGAWDWQTCTELNIERVVVFTFYKRASESLVGPVEFRLHWSSRSKMLISTPVSSKSLWAIPPLWLISM